ncbi:MAG: hypothetical protein ACP5N6_14765 [Anaerolineae bacterium]
MKETMGVRFIMAGTAMISSEARAKNFSVTVTGNDGIPVRVVSEAVSDMGGEAEGMNEIGVSLKASPFTRAWLRPTSASSASGSTPASIPFSKKLHSGRRVILISILGERDSLIFT